VAETVFIPSRFNGPPGSGNGGYASGVVAALLGGRAEVTLRTPPPLSRELAVVREDGRVEVRDGETLVAEAVPLGELVVDVPPAVSVEDAVEASRGYAGFRAHAYETCYVCGPARDDGLGIFPGPVEGRSVVAAPWTPPGEGPVADEIVWAALDCPSGWAAIVDGDGRPSVLGELAAAFAAPVRPEERCVVLGWALGGEGRKRFAGSAILGDDGAVRALARSTWIALAQA
jgi:hypothetical protein